MRLQDIDQTVNDLNGPALIAFALDAGLWFKSDISRVSGLPMARLTALENGQRPNKAERAAIKWALALRINT